MFILVSKSSMQILFVDIAEGLSPGSCRLSVAESDQFKQKLGFTETRPIIRTHTTVACISCVLSVVLHISGNFTRFMVLNLVKWLHWTFFHGFTLVCRLMLEINYSDKTKRESFYTVNRVFTDFRTMLEIKDKFMLFS